MSSSKPNQIKLVCHKHPLTNGDGCSEFICKGCKTYGCGKAYRCVECNYYLHDHCATCPLTLESYMHPQHKLQLVSKVHENEHKCNICNELTEGIYYQCKPCGFNVHPVCTKLPQHVRHVRYQAYPLELSNQGVSNTCKICDRAIHSWRYKYDPCKLAVHMECVNCVTPPSSSSSSSSNTQQRGFGSQPQFHSFQYQQPYPNYGYGHIYHAHSFPNYPPSYYNHGHMNQVHVPGLQGQVPGSIPSAGKPMFQILMALTLGTVSNLIADALGDIFGNIV